MDRLELTDDQEARLESLREEGRKQAVQMQKDLMRARHELQGEMMQDEPSMDRVREMARRIGDIETRLQIHRLEQRLAMRSVLTPEQRDKFAVGGGMQWWMDGPDGCEGRGHRGRGPRHGGMRGECMQGGMSGCMPGACMQGGMSGCMPGACMQGGMSGCMPGACMHGGMSGGMPGACMPGGCMMHGDMAPGCGKGATGPGCGPEAMKAGCGKAPAEAGCARAPQGHPGCGRQGD